MICSDFNTQILLPGVIFFKTTVPTIPLARAAWVELLTIAGQESDWQNIAQADGGPGRGPWQFEPETCAEVLTNPACSKEARTVCTAIGVDATSQAVYAALLDLPSLAFAFARLDLWANPSPLPLVGDEAGALKYYLNTWRPGKPHPGTWHTNYQAAILATAPPSKAPLPRTNESFKNA